MIGAADEASDRRGVIYRVHPGPVPATGTCHVDHPAGTVIPVDRIERYAGAISVAWLVGPGGESHGFYLEIP